MIHWKFVNAVSYKLFVGISPNLQLWCSWTQRWIVQSKVQGNSETQDCVWWNRHFGRQFLTYLWNALTNIWLILMKHTTVTCYPVHMTLVTFSKSCVQRSGSQHFVKVHTCSRGILTDGLLSKDHVLSCLCVLCVCPIGCYEFCSHCQSSHLCWKTCLWSDVSCVKLDVQLC